MTVKRPQADAARMVAELIKPRSYSAEVTTTTTTGHSCGADLVTKPRSNSTYSLKTKKKGGKAKQKAERPNGGPNNAEEDSAAATVRREGGQGVGVGGGGTVGSARVGGKHEASIYGSDDIRYLKSPMLNRFERLLKEQVCTPYHIAHCTPYHSALRTIVHSVP
jgi:hypothetical protein